MSPDMLKERVASFQDQELAPCGHAAGEGAGGRGDARRRRAVPPQGGAGRRRAPWVAGGAVNPDLAPHHPRGEGAVFALFVAAMVGYAMLVIYVFGGLLTRAG